MVVRRARSCINEQSRVVHVKGGKVGINRNGRRDVIGCINMHCENSSEKSGGSGVELLGGSNGAIGGNENGGGDVGIKVVVGIVISLV